MDAFAAWFWSTGWFWVAVFWVALAVTARAAFKLLVDWKGMCTTRRFVDTAYATLDALPDEARLERETAAPVFVHVVPAYEEPEIATTLRALLDSRYPHGKLHVVVVTREEEERAPHPAMPGEGRKAHQLNWALRPELVETLLDGQYDPTRVYIGVSDADSLPDRNTYRWIAADVLTGGGSLAYQGVTLSLGNFDRLDARGRVCAVQQSSIFIRVSIARLVGERRRVAWFAGLAARSSGVARLVRPVFELLFRRAQICLGHHEFVRLDTLQSLGLFPTAGATEDSTLGYALGARGILIQAVPLLELVDMPETTAKMIHQNARWYKGVLDDVPFLWATWRAHRSAFNLAQLCRHVGNKAIEWPIAAVVYPLLGFVGWHLAHRFAYHPVWFVLGVALPIVSLGLTVCVGAFVTQHLIERLTPHCPRPVNAARATVRAKLWGTFRCQTYWLLATRGALRVLWALLRTGRYAPAKTDRVTGAASPRPAARRWTRR